MESPTHKDWKRTIGFGGEAFDNDRLIEYLNFKLALKGQPVQGDPEAFPFLQVGESAMGSIRERLRRSRETQSAVDARAQAFLDDVLGSEGLSVARLPSDPLQIEFHGLARILSLPPNRDEYHSHIMSSYRVDQGVLHNPKNDRRTTKGVFHIVDHGLPIPADKKRVPKRAFAGLLAHALNPPKESMRLPFTADQEEQAEVFVSLLLRPTVCPDAPGFGGRRFMETRFFVPGSCVANLDFVESIFGNAGDPYDPNNNAALDPQEWTGHTGVVILAPHLTTVTKKELGLPHVSETDDQRLIDDGMVWSSEEELYNDGGGFKVTCRDHRGVVVTLIADNYFGYCKKEVKTQIGYAANLLGSAEEEHAGGAVAFPSYDLGEDFQLSEFVREVDHTFAEAMALLGDTVDIKPEGYAVDKEDDSLIFLPENVYVQLREQRISWTQDDQERVLKLLPGKVYMLPSGYKVEMIKDEALDSWRLIGTTAEGVFCHKPCTVSGGGKSEISKSIADSIQSGPVFVSDFAKDFDQVEEILFADERYQSRFKEEVGHKYRGRSLLDSERSLGSVIKLLTPRKEYNDDYNQWLQSFPPHIKQIVYAIKLLYQPHWERNIRERFSVDAVNGFAGHELKYRSQKLSALYMRIGYSEDGGWRTFSLRRDYSPAQKIQREDDISASLVAPRETIDHLANAGTSPGVKFIENCEYRFFQRPDEAIHRGYDQRTEWDFARDNLFFCNYHPTTRDEATDEVENALLFDKYTQPMADRLQGFLENDSTFVITGAFPRRVDGKPTKNPRYLQTSLNLDDPRDGYVASKGARLIRRVPLDNGVPFPVDAVLTGRRNNPAEPEAGIRPLAVFNPIHYQDVPELFMDFISSLTGKSPSTTGAGSEGALTKGPFNCLPAIYDLNAAYVSHLLTGMDGYSSAAGYIGRKYRVDHDISLLVPEVWARMSPTERQASFLIEHGFLEPLKDFDHEGERILGSRLGYRITEKFVRIFLGRLFSYPSSVMPDDMLCPEQQGMEDYVDGIKNITETQKRVAENYFKDGTVEFAVPPLKALLHIMAHGSFEGKGLDDAGLRGWFTLEHMLQSDWYAARLESQRQAEQEFLTERLKDLESAPAADWTSPRLVAARARLKRIEDPGYLASVIGTVGRDSSIPV